MYDAVHVPPTAVHTRPVESVLDGVSRNERTWLALSLVAFGVAGVGNTTLGPSLRSALAIAIVLAGCYTMYRFARVVSRRRLAGTSMACWLAFLVLSGLHLVGLETVAATVPLSSAAVLSTLEAATWGLMLGGGVSTAYLAFREYGAGTAVDAPDDVLDSDAEY